MVESKNTINLLIMKHFYLLLLFFSLSVSLCFAAQEYQVKVKTTLNVRSQPDAKSPLLGTLSNGDHIEVYDISNGWAKIKFQNKDAYISSDFISPAYQPTSSYSDTFRSSNDLKSTIVYIILGLTAIAFLIRKIKTVEEAEGGTLVFSYLILLSICALELYYFIGLGGDTWFCSPNTVGWIWTIINFFIFGGVLFIQILFFLDVLAGLQYNSRYIDYRTGFYSIGIAAALCILGYFFFEEHLYIVGIALGIAQLVQIFFIFRENGTSYLGYSLASTLLYLVATAATLITLIHFIMLLIVAIIAWVVLMAIGSSSGRTCSSCRSYDSNGYCHYRQRYVSSGSSCNKYE